ncbi:MAG: hypothetical protein EOO21_01095, partial [Comamonadaceae bacterium]
MHFDFHNPYPTTRIPVFARNVVSTSHPLAALPQDAQAGLGGQRVRGRHDVAREDRDAGGGVRVVEIEVHGV